MWGENDFRDELVAGAKCGTCGKGVLKPGATGEEKIDIVWTGCTCQNGQEWAELKLTSAVNLDQLWRQRSALEGSGEKNLGKRHYIAVVDQADGYGARRAGFTVRTLDDLCDRWLEDGAAGQLKAKVVKAVQRRPRRLKQQRTLLCALKGYDDGRRKSALPLDETVSVEANAEGPPSITFRRPIACGLVGLEGSGGVQVFAQVQFPRKGEDTSVEVSVGMELADLALDGNQRVDLTGYQLLVSRTRLSELEMEFERGLKAYKGAWVRTASLFLEAAEASLPSQFSVSPARSTKPDIWLPLQDHRYRKGYRGFPTYQGFRLNRVALAHLPELVPALDAALSAGLLSVQQALAEGRR